MIESRKGGIELTLHFSAGGSIEHTTIVNNTIRSLQARLGFGIHLGAGFWAGSQGNKIIDSLIAYNTIEGSPGAGIRVAAGDVGAGRNTVNDVHIVGNRLRLNRSRELLWGIAVVVGDAATDWADPNFRPIGYPEDNQIRNVWIVGNTFEEANFGIQLSLGSLGSRRNAISHAFVLGNAITGLTPGTYRGVILSGGGEPSKVERRPSRENEMSNIIIQHNTIRLPPPIPFTSVTGLEIIGGQLGAEDNRITDVLVSHNDVDGEGIIGVNVMAGWGDPRLVPLNNTVSRVEISCNRVVSNPGNFYEVERAGIIVIGEFSYARGNRVEHIRLDDNLVAGVLNDVSVLANLRIGASGNIVELATTTQAVALKARITQLEEQIKSLETKIAQFQKEMDSVKSQLPEKVREAESLKEQLTRQKAEADFLKAELAKMKGVEVELASSKEQLQTALSIYLATAVLVTAAVSGLLSYRLGNRRVRV